MYYLTVNTPLVIVDNLDLVRVTCAKHETYAELIVNPNAPMPGPSSLEFLQPVAGRYTQESDFGGRQILVLNAKLADCRTNTDTIAGHPAHG